MQTTTPGNHELACSRPRRPLAWCVKSSLLCESLAAQGQSSGSPALPASPVVRVAPNPRAEIPGERHACTSSCLARGQCPGPTPGCAARLANKESEAVPAPSPSAPTEPPAGLRVILGWPSQEGSSCTCGDVVATAFSVMAAPADAISTSGAEHL